MKQLLEWTGMGMVAIGAVFAAAGIVVLVVTEDSWVLYASGWVTVGLGVLTLFWSVLRDRLNARKTENLDDVGFN